MSLIRIATVNALESASASSGLVNPDYPPARLTDRNNAREMRSPAAAATITGGTITTYGAYTVHTFLAGGSLVVTGGNPIAAEVLVVGGGGGGSTGGGGAGGMRSAAQVLAGNMTVYVGAGGAGAAGNETPYNNGASGGASAIGAIVAAGGGGGAGSGKNGLAGGSSGGGGSWASGTTTSPAASPAGEGNTGGGNGGFTANPYAAGGGGGAGAAGAAAPSANTGGAGGNGSANSLRTGSPITYAGGGGGGTYNLGTPGAGGSGGGGAANDSDGNGTAGATNLGGGGGGAGALRTGGAGGSGIVVVRYLTADLALAGRVYTWGPGMAAIDVNALVIPAGHTVGGMAYTLERSDNGTDWTAVSGDTFASGADIIVLEFGTVSPDYWRVTLPDDAAVSMTEMLLTNIYTVTRNPARPSGVLQTDYNVKKNKTSAGSARFIEYGPSSRQRNYDFNNASTADTTALLTRTAALGMKKPFYLCDHEGSWIWGNLEEPIAPVEISYSRRKFSFNFRETLG